MSYGPPPGGEGQPQVAPRPARVALVLACLAGAVNVLLDLVLSPHGIGYVLIMLASVGLAMATGFAERVVPVPREEKHDEPADG